MDEIRLSLTSASGERVMDLVLRSDGRYASRYNGGHWRSFDLWHNDTEYCARKRWSRSEGWRHTVPLIDAAFAELGVKVGG